MKDDMENRNPLVRFNAKRCFKFLKHQVALGPRSPGSKGHKRIVRWLTEEMKIKTRDVLVQKYLWNFRGQVVAFTNVIGKFKGYEGRKTLLLGTHFDTRWRADNEFLLAEREKPILGANDGGSGTAILLEMACLFEKKPPRENVLLAFFDAEDIGDIDGYNYSEGADYFCRHAPLDFLPDEAIILDMVAGEKMRLTLDAHSFLLPRSQEMIKEIFDRGRALKYPPFFKNTARAIVCDHIPFIQLGIPAILLIDMDYPQWHTHRDTIDHCSPRSLQMIGKVLLDYVE